MEERTGGRWAAACGLGFLILFAVAAAAYGGGAGSTQQDVAAYYADAGNRAHQIAGFAVLVVATVLLLPYVAGLTRRTVSSGAWSQTALMSGAAMAVLLMLANALWAATAFTVQIQGSYSVDAGTHLLIEDTAFVCVITAMAAAIPWVLITSVSGARSGAMPQWFVVLGILAALGLALSYWFVPLVGFFAWVLAGAVLGDRRTVRAD